MDQNHKRCIVTGAASGIGLELVKGLLEVGAQVVGIDRQECPMEFDSPRFMPLYADLSIAANVATTYDQAKQWLGEVDLYIANAGQARYGADSAISETDTRLLIDLNVISVIEAFRVLRQDRLDRPFTFVAISSAVSKMPLPGYAVYAATKAAVSAYIQGVRYELSADQKAHLVYPVATQTNFFQVSGQRHTSWFIQSPRHVAHKILRGLTNNTQDIYPSTLFAVLHRIFPIALRIYLFREKNIFKKTIQKR
jgi:uncharacterized protein